MGRIITVHNYYDSAQKPIRISFPPSFLPGVLFSVMGEHVGAQLTKREVKDLWSLEAVATVSIQDPAISSTKYARVYENGNQAHRHFSFLVQIHACS